jgi:hypothetical protein
VLLPFDKRFPPSPALVTGSTTIGRIRLTLTSAALSEKPILYETGLRKLSSISAKLQLKIANMVCCDDNLYFSDCPGSECCLHISNPVV